MKGPAEGASQKWSGSWNEMLVVPFPKGHTGGGADSEQHLLWGGAH